MEVEDWFPGRYLKWLLLILAVKLIVFGLFHQYKGWWRYASVSDLLSIIKASHLSTVIIVVGWYVSNYIPTTRKWITGSNILNVPVAVMLIDWGMTIVVICGARLAIRLYYEETQTVSGGRLTRLLIIGAGNAAK